MSLKKEASNVALFSAAVMAMIWVARKLKGTWAGLILLKGRDEE